MDAQTKDIESSRTSAARGRAWRLARQLHLWIGAWGALAAILFGSTGIMQNHRAILKLPQGTSSEASNVDIEVPTDFRNSPETLQVWLRDQQHVPIDAARVQTGANVDLNGQHAHQPERWTFSGGNARLAWNADYVPGNSTIRVRSTAQSPLAIASRLHKGIGGGVAWILLTDSFALAMIALGISGLLLWARGRSAMQMIFSIVGVAVLAIVVIGSMAVS